MNEHRISLTQDILVAFVDHELPAEQMAAVQAALAHDAMAQEAVRRLEVAARIAKQVSADAIGEPLPLRLIAAARGRAPAGQPGMSTSRRLTASNWLLPFAAGIAVLAIGFTCGYLVRDLSTGYTAAEATTTDQLAASFEATLQGSLDAGSLPGQAFAYESPGIGQGKIILGGGFSTAYGRECREFRREETRGGLHSAGDGIACRAADGSWNVMFFRGPS